MVRPVYIVESIASIPARQFDAAAKIISGLCSTIHHLYRSAIDTRELKDKETEELDNSITISTEQSNNVHPTMLFSILESIPVVGTIYHVFKGEPVVKNTQEL